MLMLNRYIVRHVYHLYLPFCNFSMLKCDKHSWGWWGCCEFGRCLVINQMMMIMALDKKVFFFFFYSFKRFNKIQIQSCERRCGLTLCQCVPMMQTHTLADNHLSVSTSCLHTDKFIPPINTSTGLCQSLSTTMCVCVSLLVRHRARVSICVCVCVCSYMTWMVASVHPLTASIMVF